MTIADSQDTGRGENLRDNIYAVDMFIEDSRRAFRTEYPRQKAQGPPGESIWILSYEVVFRSRGTARTLRRNRFRLSENHVKLQRCRGPFPCASSILPSGQRGF